MPTKSLGGRTLFEALYGVKPDVSHLRAFGAPCTSVEPTERLRKGQQCVSSWGTSTKEAATGFGTRKGKLSSSLEILVFFEDGLPPPTLNDSHPQPADEDEPTTQPALDHTTEPTTLPAVPDPPAPTLPLKASPRATHDNGPTTTPHPRIINEKASCGTQRRIR